MNCFYYDGKPWDGNWDENKILCIEYVDNTITRLLSLIEQQSHGIIRDFDENFFVINVEWKLYVGYEMLTVHSVEEGYGFLAA